jgi:peroxiredoxin Q/BCP
MSKPEAGKPAPDFELVSQDFTKVRLSQFRGHHPVVIFFYPKDDTSGCTKEACGFRDARPEFEALGAKLIGISSDSEESHARFAAKYQLPFILLSDKGGKVRKLYQVKSTLGIIPGRATFVIDRDGVLIHEFSSQTAPTRHIDEALAALRRVQRV